MAVFFKKGGIQQYNIIIYMYIIWGDGEVRSRKERKCTECDSGEVEDVKHFLIRCKALNREREELMEKMKKVATGLDEVEEERNAAWILDLACRNESIARGVEKLWTARFVQK